MGDMRVGLCRPDRPDPSGYAGGLWKGSDAMDYFDADGVRPLLAAFVAEATLTADNDFLPGKFTV